MAAVSLALAGITARAGKKPMFQFNARTRLGSPRVWAGN